ncbi:hypothetical protein ACGF5F_15880 [Streptomyces sp. NPDC047821]|uniref:hypothetical protein n=1 Tax=Streptomyces sp. NPDC047821 TaxID=3365488 RepID=UPI003723566A
MFGRDGSGGHAAFWLTNPGRVIDDQPVVFLGSEGDAAVVARDLPDFLWLLAGGYGPLEATPAFTTLYQPNWIPRPNPELIATAERFAAGPRRAAAEVIERAARHHDGAVPVTVRRAPAQPRNRAPAQPRGACRSTK